MAHWLLSATGFPQGYQQRPNKNAADKQDDFSALRQLVKGSGEEGCALFCPEGPG